MRINGISMSGIGTVRRDPFVFSLPIRDGPRSSAPWLTLRRIISTLFSKSKSVSIRPQTSPMRMPPAQAARYTDNRV